MEEVKATEIKRTRADVDKDYTQEALFCGHKLRIVTQLKAELARVEKEIAAHTDKLMALNAEGMALPPEHSDKMVEGA